MFTNIVYPHPSNTFETTIQPSWYSSSPTPHESSILGSPGDLTGRPGTLEDLSAPGTLRTRCGIGSCGFFGQDPAFLGINIGCHQLTPTLPAMCGVSLRADHRHRSTQSDPVIRRSEHPSVNPFAIATRSCIVNIHHPRCDAHVHGTSIWHVADGAGEDHVRDTERLNMKKILCGSVAVLAISLAGCGTSVSQVRQEALERLDGMVYADQAKFRRELEVADSKEKVEALIEAAERDNQKTADKYWSCAAHAAEALEGSTVWTSSATSPDGQESISVQLQLNADGTASLVELHRSVNTLRATLTPSAGDAWVTDRIGTVTGWSSNAKELVSNRQWIGDFTPSVSGPKACSLPFTLSVTTTNDATEQQKATVEIGKNPGLFLADGKGFGLEKE